MLHRASPHYVKYQTVPVCALISVPQKFLPFFCDESSEVRAVADFVSRNNVVLYVAFHNCGQFYLTPYGYTNDEAPDYGKLVG